MSITESVKTCFNKYVTFKGRAIRSEYWWFTIFATALIVLLPLLVLAVFNFVAMLFAYVAAVFAVSLPMWSVTVRRLHDTNHSGWWMLCPLYPTILMFMKGSEGENDYGAGESDLQLPCPICSELVDANVSVCPHCGEATHFDVVEPASGIDKKVAIGVLALCGLLLIGGIALSFSGSSTETDIYGGYDLSEEEDYDLEVVDTLAVEIDDIDYPDDAGAVSAAEIDEKLIELAEFAKGLQEVVESGVSSGSNAAVQIAMEWDELSIELKRMRKYMTPAQEREYEAYEDGITYLFSIWE